MNLNIDFAILECWKKLLIFTFPIFKITLIVAHSVFVFKLRNFEWLFNTSTLSFGFDNKSALAELIKIVDIPFLPWFPWLSSARSFSKVESVWLRLQ